MTNKINTRVLMSGADYFTDDFAINALMDSSIKVDNNLAIKEHADLERIISEIGTEIIKVEPPHDSQDGVYTANWGLCRGNRVILSSLPNMRKSEEAYAKKILTDLGFELIDAPYKFSGQGDALPCGNLLFCGSRYRTDPRMWQFIEDNLGFQVIGLETIPKRDTGGNPVINTITGWPDSFFYDIDLAIAVINENLIAWCPEAFSQESQKTIRGIDIEKIEVSLEEASNGYCCNLISNGESIVMSANAPIFKQELESRGFITITPQITELCKGGGFIRCTTLTLNNS